MSIRWRVNGDLVCAAMSETEPNDTYINDHLHYQLSAISKAIIVDVDHEKNGLWHWVHKIDPKTGFNDCSSLRAEPEKLVLSRLDKK